MRETDPQLKGIVRKAFIVGRETIIMLGSQSCDRIVEEFRYLI